MELLLVFHYQSTYYLHRIIRAAKLPKKGEDQFMATPQMATEKEMLQFNLGMTPAASELLEQLAAKTHSTKDEVLVKAIVLFDLAVDANLQEKKVGITEKDNSLFKEIVGIN
ncbi:MAG: hypothetical protein ACRD82_06145 [Blastocatellia bacterium]